jgi:prefoldin subunit 5
MQTFRRALIAIGMAVSILLLVLSLTGIAGTWIVRDQLHTDLMAVATAAETQATRVQQGLDRLDAVLTLARGQITAMEREVQAFGTSLEENRPLLAAISDAIGIDLSPLVESAQQTMATVREAVVAVNSAIEAVNAIPFISVPVPELQTLQKLSQDVEAFRTEVQAVRTAIDQRRSEIIQGTVSIVANPVSEIGATLDEMSDSVSGYSQQVGAVQDGLSGFKAAIGRTLTWVAVGLTLSLLWIAFSQGVLLVLGWRAFSERTLQPRERNESSTS